MKKNIKAWIIIFSALCLCGAAHAQSDLWNKVTTAEVDAAEAMSAGVHEISISGAIDLDGPVGDEYGLDLFVGKYMWDHVLIGPRVGFMDTDLGTDWTLGGKVEFNLVDIQKGGLVPFVGVAAQYIDSGTVDDESVLGEADAGVKIFLSQSVALATRAVYQLAEDEVFLENDGSISDDNWRFDLQLRFML